MFVAWIISMYLVAFVVLFMICKHTKLQTLVNGYVNTPEYKH